MLNYAGRRLLMAVPVLIGVTTLVFLMMHLLPGDPIQIMLQGAPVSAETVASLRHQLGLDRPLLLQYLIFLGHAVQGDFGRSLATNEPVRQLIFNQFPATFQLTLAAGVVAVIAGLFFGIVSAIYRNSWVDQLVRVINLLGVSMPTFWTGTLLIMLFALKLGWFPATGVGGVQRLVLPALTLGLNAAAIIARLVRHSVLEVIREQYVTTARGKGLPERVVIFKHIMRNALVLAVTIIGVQVGNMMAGAVIIETVFSRQGIGRLAVTAITGKDFPVVQGTVFFAALGYVLINVLVDLTYAVIDPRIHIATEGS